MATGLDSFGIPIPGFELATEIQVLQLFNGMTSSDLAAFIGPFGDTNISSSQQTSFGLYESNGGVQLAGGTLTDTFANGVLDSDLFLAYTNGPPAPMSLDVRFSDVGVFLVQRVPEPTTLALLIVGLAGISVTRKKYKM